MLQMGQAVPASGLVSPQNSSPGFTLFFKAEVSVFLYPALSKTGQNGENILQFLSFFKRLTERDKLS